MITLLSPAKKLLSIKKIYADETSETMFDSKTAELIKIMKHQSVDSIAKLMDLSEDLAQLNYDRYQAMNSSSQSLSYPAIHYFQGDVYQSLRAKEWSKKTLNFAQSHLKILSGLYGILNPLDLIQAYRLEMGVKLANSRGTNLYEFWSETVTEYLNQELAHHQNPQIINLASNEYSKVVNRKKLNFPIIDIHFYENKNEVIKMIGIYSKKARGMMAKFIMENQLDDLESLKHFNQSGYQFNAASSTVKCLEFVRKH